MNDNDKSYLAGFIDGEACIGIYQLSLKLQITNTDLSILEYIKSKYGGYICKEKLRSSKHNQAWHYAVSSKNALNILKDVYPFLRVKRAQALVAIYYQENMKNLSVNSREILQEEIKQLKIPKII